MKNPPYMPFRVRDWLADSHVRRMTFEERGIYLELILFNYEDDGLPSEIEELARLCHLPLKKFERIWHRLSRHFEPFTCDGEQLLYNRKLFEMLSEKDEKDKEKSSPSDLSRIRRRAAMCRWHPDQVESHNGSLLAIVDAKPDANSMQNASETHAKSNANGGVSHARAHARHTANAIANASAKSGVEEKGSGEKPPSADAKPDAKPDAQSDANTMAQRFIAIRQSSIGIRPQPDDPAQFREIFADLSDVAATDDIGSVLRLLKSAKGKRHWKFGIGHRPGKKTHPLITQFGSLIADAEEQGFRRKPEEKPPPETDEDLPSFDPLPPDLWPSALKVFAAEEPGNTETWLQPLIPLGRLGDEIWLGTSSSFHRNWIAANFTSKLSEHLGAPVRIAIVPQPEEAPPEKKGKGHA